MLESVKWGEFKIGNLFEKLNLNFKKSKFDKLNDVSKEKTSEFTLPLVNAKNGDNGIMYYGRKDDFESEIMTIDIVNDGAVSTGNVYPQPQRTGVLYNAYLIKSFFKSNNELLFFFAAAIQKSIKLKYGYQNKAGWNKVKEDIIQLPICQDGTINFSIKEKFIAELEATHLAELEAYLSVSGLKDYELTSEEIRALEDFENKEWLNFQIKDLFKVNSYKKRFDANKVTILEKGEYPYIVRTSFNNGVRGYLKEKTDYLNDENTISFGQDTATMFYQKTPYFTGDKIKILKNKDNNFNEEKALFLITSMKKSFESFTWGAKSYSENVIKSQKIKVPQINKEIDYEFMEVFISAIKKLVIKDVVLYSERKMKLTESVIKS